MRMMPITASADRIPQGIENKSNISNDSIEKSLFKVEYDKKIENKQSETYNERSKESNIKDPDNKNRVEKKNEQSKDEPLTDKNLNTKDIKDFKIINSSKIKKDLLDTNTKTNKNDNSQIKSDEKTNEKTNENKINVLRKNIKDIQIENPSKSKIVENDDKSKKSEKKLKVTDDENLNQNLVSQLNSPVEINKKILTTKTENKNEEVTNINNEKETRKVGTNNDINQKIIFQKDTSVENKSKSEKKDKTENDKLKVIDFRKDKKSQVVENTKQNKEEDIKIEKSNDIQSKEIVKNEDTNDDIILGLKDVTVEGDGGKQQAPILKEIASQIKQQLKDFGNNEIVKQSKFILKDNNIGEIKLILKPESLGQVKINLNLNENSLAGQIVVENNSVKEIFQENMANLTKALEDQGYDSTKLELSMEDKSDSRDEKRENKQYFSERLKRIDESGNVVRYGLASAGIDLTA